MAKTNKATAVETNGAAKTASKAKAENAVDASMFDVTITRAGGSNRWRVAIEANGDHPTDSGEVEVRTVKSLDAAAEVIESAIESLCDDSE